MKCCFTPLSEGVETEEPDYRPDSLHKDGLNLIKAKVVIDATGDGDIAAFAGAPMTKGNRETARLSR